MWNKFVARYHYLGYKILVGAQMRYASHERNGWPLARPGFSTTAWTLVPSDRFIGWTPWARKKNLLLVDHPRFLVLPWFKIPNLGSHILALVRRRLRRDSTQRYNTTLVRIETIVETPRFTGGVYRASGWVHVGATQGSGRYDTHEQYDKPKKEVWLQPLTTHWKRILNQQIHPRPRHDRTLAFMVTAQPTHLQPRAFELLGLPPETCVHSSPTA